ncbi:MAG TPA: ribosome biogenesis GTP-binding protein YihA/YsxC [Thermoanaerobaculia bacterium]|nr:ribosome biogenesis GTP-binding protein YihA/YsxC [Thermoanaerobaculia bacterium]
MKIETAEHVLEAHGEAQFVRDDRPQIAFVGRSNVGKSSLMNRLLGRKGLARTSSTPGRTRAIHYYLVNRRLYFVDLPGYGYAKVSESARREWGELVERYFLGAPAPPLVIQLVDAKVGATRLDVEARGFLASLGVPQVVAATKADRLSGGRAAAVPEAVRRSLGVGDEVRVLPVSAHSGKGINELWKEIESFLRGGPGTVEKEHHG